MKTLTTAICIATALAGSGIALFRRLQEEDAGSTRKHKLAAALRLAEKAQEMIQAAEQAGEFDSEGHAMKARLALELVNSEIRQATAEPAAEPPAPEMATAT